MQVLGSQIIEETYNNILHSVIWEFMSKTKCANIKQNLLILLLLDSRSICNVSCFLHDVDGEDLVAPCHHLSVTNTLYLYPWIWLSSDRDAVEMLFHSAN